MRKGEEALRNAEPSPKQRAHLEKKGLADVVRAERIKLRDGKIQERTEIFRS